MLLRSSSREVAGSSSRACGPRARTEELAPKPVALGGLALEEHREAARLRVHAAGRLVHAEGLAQRSRRLFGGGCTLQRLVDLGGVGLNLNPGAGTQADLQLSKRVNRVPAIFGSNLVESHLGDYFSQKPYAHFVRQYAARPRA